MKTQNTNSEIPQIAKSSVMAEGSHGELYILDNRFKNICKNIKKFNGSRLTYKTTKVGNGKTFEVFHNERLHTKIYLLSDRNGWSIERTTFR